MEGADTEDISIDEAVELYIMMKNEFSGLKEKDKEADTIEYPPKPVLEATTKIDDLSSEKQRMTDLEADELWRKVQDELGMDLASNEMTIYDHDIDEALQEKQKVPPSREMQLLREALPTVSDTRLRRIYHVFQASLGDPSLLNLVPLLRERMPDYITGTWLKQWSALTGRYVLQQAGKEDLVDVHMINGALELEGAAGRLGRALSLYETAFDEYGLEPTPYTDRLVVQMLLKNNRFSRAMQLKQQVEEDGRTLDLPSYGSLIDYCARRQQLGSALMMLKEAVARHDAAPPEATVSQLRILCRKADVDISDLVGQDPVAWLRHGEAHLKREQTKRGRRGVLHARNLLVQA